MASSRRHNLGPLADFDRSRSQAFPTWDPTCVKQLDLKLLIGPTGANLHQRQRITVSKPVIGAAGA